MALAAGRLRHRVEIEEQISERDSDGVLVTYWAPVASVWAAVEPVSVKEWIQSGQMQSEVKARFVIRYRPDIRASMRIVHRGLYYNIVGAFSDKESGREYLTLPVTEGVNDGQ